MDTQLAPAAASSTGTVHSLTHSLANLGTATKAFVVAHPIGVTFVGGVVVGMIIYGTFFAGGKKSQQNEVDKQAATAG